MMTVLMDMKRLEKLRQIWEPLWAPRLKHFKLSSRWQVMIEVQSLSVLKQYKIQIIVLSFHFAGKTLTISVQDSLELARSVKE